MTHIDLRKKFPITFVFVLRRNVNTILIGLAAIGIAVVINYLSKSMNAGALNSFFDFIRLYKVIFLSILLFCLSGKLLYDYLYLQTYKYYIDEDRLHIESGVIIRQEASVPLTPLCEFYLERRPIDLIFQTRDLVMKAAIGEGQEVVRLQALTEPVARPLKNFLIERSRQGRSPKLDAVLSDST